MGRGGEELKVKYKKTDQTETFYSIKQLALYNRLTPRSHNPITANKKK
jgi:hypothetical protein